MRQDYAVFLLASKPRGVRALAADGSGAVSSGTRVRLLGPGTGKQGEREIPGEITGATAEQIEIELDAASELAGWGGAPVLAADSGGVIGILEATLPGEGKTRVLAAPIGGVLDALREPLDGGKGRRFDAFASAAPAPGAQAAAPPAAASARKGLIQPTAGKATNLELSIEYPRDGAEVSSSACGTFVAGRAQATRGAPRRFDVILVVDTSISAAEAAGSDVNGNGVVGRAASRRIGSASVPASPDSPTRATRFSRRRSPRRGACSPGSIRAARASASWRSRATRPDPAWSRASPRSRSRVSRASTRRSSAGSTSCSPRNPAATPTWRRVSIRR